VPRGISPLPKLRTEIFPGEVKSTKDYIATTTEPETEEPVKKEGE